MIKNQHWCMCEKLKAVARDGHSTCFICGGKDAYGLSTERPDDKKKTIYDNCFNLTKEVQSEGNS